MLRCHISKILAHEAGSCAYFIETFLSTCVVRLRVNIGTGATTHNAACLSSLFEFGSESRRKSILLLFVRLLLLKLLFVLPLLPLRSLSLTTTSSFLIPPLWGGRSFCSRGHIMHPLLHRIHLFLSEKSLVDQVVNLH
jgi:hypothetical protein